MSGHDPNPVVVRRRQKPAALQPEASPTTVATPAPVVVPVIPEITPAAGVKPRPVNASPTLTPAPAPSVTRLEPHPVSPPGFVQPTHTLGEPHVVAEGRVTPPERFDPEGSWDMEEVGSRVDDPRVQAHKRIDPVYDEVWQGSGSGAASWLTHTTATKHAELGMGRLPKRFRLDPATEAEGFTRNRGLTERLSVLGTLFSWRTCSVQQAAALTGQSSLLSERSHTLPSLFAAGVADLGVYVSGIRSSASFDPHHTLIRPNRGAAYPTKVAPNLTWPERVAITGGLPWVTPAQYDRHNVLATELGLRFAEFADVGTVLGERFSTVDLLAGTGVGREQITSQRSADLTVVRRDGLRIAIELTASVSKMFGTKVARWAELLATCPLDETGLVVVFVIVDSDQRAPVYRAIAEATKRFPGTVADRVAKRIGVATWREWFPAKGRVGDGFFSARADVATGPDDEMLWEPCDFLDEGVSERAFRFTPADPRRVSAVLDNAAVLAQTPVWLRRHRTPPELHTMLTQRAALPELVEPTSKRVDRPRVQAVTATAGAVAEIQPPARLRGLALPAA